MSYRMVGDIPERKYNFKMSETTKQYIEFLSRIRDGDTIEFSPKPEYDEQERELYLRKVRDRLKSATKHVPGSWKVRRRNNSYYAKRISGFEAPT